LASQSGGVQGSGGVGATFAAASAAAAFSFSAAEACGKLQVFVIVSVIKCHPAAHAARGVARTLDPVEDASAGAGRMGGGAVGVALPNDDAAACAATHKRKVKVHAIM
jgi:hypothetical protein